MALTELELLEAVVPEVTIRGVTLENYRDNGMLATVEYAIYDVVDDSAISKFFADPSFDKYLRIKTQYNTSPSRTRPSSWQNGGQPQNVSDLFTDNNYFKSKTLSDGSIRKEFRWTKEYKFVDLRPNHLEFYIKSYIDTNAIEEDMGLDPDTFVLDTQGSAANTDWLVVLKWSLDSSYDSVSVLGTEREQRPDTKLQPVSKVYGKKIMYIYNVDVEGGQQNMRKEWHGLVHQMDRKSQRWMTGETHTENSFSVDRVEERFRDIQDFRDFDNTNSHVNGGEYLGIDGGVQYGPNSQDSYQDLLFKISRYERESILELEKAARQSTAFNSDIWISRSISGDARFLTALDLRTLLLNNSKFSRYIDNMSRETIEELVSSVGIVSLRVKRKRIQKIKVNSGHEYIEFKDDNYKDEIVIETVRQPGAASITTARTQAGSIRQISLPQETDLIFLTGTDYLMSDITDGIYTYGIDIKILDPTRDYLREKVEQLYPYIIALEAIRTQAENAQNFYDRNAEAYNKGFIEEFQIDFKDEKYGRLEIYDSFESNRQILYADFMQEVLNKYFDTIRIFQRTSYDGQADFITGLKTAAKTSSKGLGLLISIMKTLCNRLSNIVGLRNIGFDDLGNTTINRNALHEIYKSKYCMSENSIWDSNVPHGSGIDYLSDPLVEVTELQRLQQDDQSIGLRVVQPEQFSVRQMNEITRFFNASPMNITLPVTPTSTSNNFSLTNAGSAFMTPSAFINNGGIYQHEADNNNTSETIINNFLPLVNNYSSNSNFGSPPPPPANQPISGGNMSQTPMSSLLRTVTARNIFSDFNVTFENYGELTNIVDRNTISSQLEDIINTCIAVNVPGRPIDPHVDISPDPEIESGNASSREFDLGAFTLRRTRRVFLSSANLIADGFGPPPPPRQNSSYESEPAPNVPISANYDISSASAISNSILPSVNISNFVDQLPNQIKSLMLSSLPIPESQSHTGNSYSLGSGLNLGLSGVYQINTGFLATIEFFRGFRRIRGRRGRRRTGLMRPINFSDVKWEELTIDKYREHAGERLLCRIRKADLSDLGIQQNDFGIPIYDSYFFIEPRTDRVVASSTDIIQDARDQREARAAAAQRRAEARLAVEDAQLEKARLLTRNEDMRAENERLTRDISRLEDLIDRTDEDILVVLRNPESYHAPYDMLIETGQLVEGDSGELDVRYGHHAEVTERLVEISKAEYDERMESGIGTNHLRMIAQRSNTPMLDANGNPRTNRRGETMMEFLMEVDPNPEPRRGVGPDYGEEQYAGPRMRIVYKYYEVYFDLEYSNERWSEEDFKSYYSRFSPGVYIDRHEFAEGYHFEHFGHRLTPAKYSWYVSRIRAMDSYNNMIEVNRTNIQDNEDMIVGHRRAIERATDDQIISHSGVAAREQQIERRAEDLGNLLDSLEADIAVKVAQQEEIYKQEEYVQGRYNSPPNHMENELNGDGQWLYDRLQQEIDNLRTQAGVVRRNRDQALQDHRDGSYITPFAE